MPLRNRLRPRRRRPHRSRQTNHCRPVAKHRIHPGDDGIAAGLGHHNLLIGYGTRRDIAVGYLKTQRRVHRVKPVVDGFPGFPAL